MPLAGELSHTDLEREYVVGIMKSSRNYFVQLALDRWVLCNFYVSIAEFKPTKENEMYTNRTYLIISFFFP